MMKGHWQTQVCEIKGAIGVLQRGTVLASGTGGDIGKLVKLTAGTEAAAYGILLDAADRHGRRLTRTEASALRSREPAAFAVLR